VTSVVTKGAEKAFYETIMKHLSMSLLALLFTICTGLPQPIEVAPGVMQLGTFQNPNITESSGVVSSRLVRGTYWTHNDGGAPVLYGFTTNGSARGEWSIQNLEVRDWEDIESGVGRLYIADIGNNHGEPGDIYVVSEPNPRRSGNLRVLRRVKLDYPGSAFDSESFFISHSFGYIIEKESGNAHVYRFRLSGRTAGRLVEQCDLNTGSPVTGADVTKDSRRLAVITDAGAYLFPLPRRVPTTGTLQPTLFVPYALEGMEGCTFTRNGLLVTAETGQILLFTDPLFRIH
jgi:hypothetical protein